VEGSLEFFRPCGAVRSAGSRRRWPDDLKARIVAETLEPGVTVCGVADRYGVRASRVSEWRRLAKDGKLVLPAAEGPPGFATLAVCDAERPAPEAEGVATERDVRIAVGEVVIQLDADTCPTRIAEIVRALAGAE